MSRLGSTKIAQDNSIVSAISALQDSAALPNTTPEQMLDWTKGKAIGRGKMHGAFLENYLRSHPQPERIPGQDDEEMAA